MRPKVGSLPSGEKAVLLWCPQYTASLRKKSTYTQCPACVKQNRTFGPFFVGGAVETTGAPVHTGIDLVLTGSENFPNQFLRIKRSRAGDVMKVTARVMRLRGENRGEFLRRFGEDGDGRPVWLPTCRGIVLLE